MYFIVVSNGREPDESSDYDVNEQTYRKTEVSNDKDDFHFQVKVHMFDFLRGPKN